MNDATLAAAFEDWRRELGADAVLDGAAAEARHGACTMATRRRILGAIAPADADAVRRAVLVAGRHRVALYPFSTGHNWGYGSAHPARDDCVLVDLSRLDRVIEFDRELGIVTLEPGVTQRALREFLDARDAEYLVPVHGGGPTCSLLGNALERGYGITPHTDHFAAVMALEAVLANGETYRTPLTLQGAGLADRVFKWGTGPYLDGLFTQGAFGIVTRMSIALAPRPESTMAFFFGVREDAELEAITERVQRVLRRTQGVAGSVNLMNRRRVLSMMVPYPEGVPAQAVISDDQVAQLGRANQVMAWTGAGALYGQRRVVAAAVAEVKAALRPLARRLLFVSAPRLARVRALTRFVPGFATSKFGNVLATFDKTLQLLGGAPSEIALPLAYWRVPQRRPGQGDLDPARDGCGLIWYAPLVPMKPALVRTYTGFVDSVCRKHGIEPLITLTSLSERCFDSTVPLLFDARDEAAVARARACYDELRDGGRALGFLPYRSSVDAMGAVVQADTPYWRMVRDFKAAVDPDNLIAPGRYAP